MAVLPSDPKGLKMEYFGRRLAPLFVVALLFAVSGCSHNSSNSTALDQQKKDVIGGPPPESARAEIEAAKARSVQAPPPAGKQ